MPEGRSRRLREPQGTLGRYAVWPPAMAAAIIRQVCRSCLCRQKRLLHSLTRVNILVLKRVIVKTNAYMISSEAADFSKHDYVYCNDLISQLFLWVRERFQPKVV